MNATLPHATVWKTTRFEIDLGQPQVMGIVNVTPDSFSDGGRHDDPARALAHAEQLLKEGATILDIGGESTRPGAPPVPLQQELDRVLPVLREALKLGVPLSIDTYKPEVMQACLDLGADIINDVWALQRPFENGQGSGVEVVAHHPACGVCLMHMHLEPQSMQIAPMTGDVVPQVVDFLRQRAERLLVLGVARERIVLDYGIGFGKTVAQNFSLLARQPELLALGYPLLSGWSRKSSLGAVTGREIPRERVAASVAAHLLAVERGARIVRVHDVRETVDAIKVWQAMQAQA
ncbi:dihydropteroate synthase [Malikia granosa]|uniref:Dihydropteroate synthase n=1 Tax=Malikia granosa TaxID=263067 RepID=A0A2S9K567_9BURK|nr:dihydropteroate synthase [Malikia granosa]PRD65608.1 dihydropteroate synthase [Malikia granosa]